ncbi:MAG TPA: lysozyme inhibitor LprI family protein [Thiolinea sp.]|nr:lysozyme inhibitor LprI family protein [Thiolinea sp.]
MNTLKRILIMTALLSPLSLPAQAASFDCGKAESVAEKAVCADVNVSALDDLLALAYAKTQASAPNQEVLKEQQTAWIAERDDCKDELACLKATYQTRLVELIDRVANPDRLLKGTIKSFECGDNCYLTVTDEAGKEQVGLCTAEMCGPWNEETKMPDDMAGKPVEITIRVGVQIDGDGNVMDEMDAFDEIRILE